MHEILTSWAVLISGCFSMSEVETVRPESLHDKAVAAGETDTRKLESYAISDVDAAASR